MHKPVVRDHDARKWTQEDRVAAHECQEALCTGVRASAPAACAPIPSRRALPGENLPRAERPACEDSTDGLPPADIDVSWEEHGHIVRGRERVRGDVRAEGGQHPHERREEGRSAVVPVIDELQRVPEHLAVEHGARRRHRDTDKARKCEGNGDDHDLDVSAGVVSVE